jgi:hypothetical protein
MHPLFAKADNLSGDVIGAAIEVHRMMGRMALRLPEPRPAYRVWCPVGVF